MRLPRCASNVGTHLYLDRGGINISLKVEATLKALLYWYKVQNMADSRLPKICYLHQLEEMQKGNTCWVKNIKTILDNIGLQELWNNISLREKDFRQKCAERLITIERERLLILATYYPSLIPLRTVQTLAGRDSLLVNPEIKSNPEKHRWIVIDTPVLPGESSEAAGRSVSLRSVQRTSL